MWKGTWPICKNVATWNQPQAIFFLPLFVARRLAPTGAPVLLKVDAQGADVDILSALATSSLPLATATG